MDIETYLEEVEHAATTVIAALWSDHVALESLAKDVERLAAAAAAGYRNAGAWIESDDPDDFMLGVGTHWETYFGPDKEHAEAHKNAGALHERILARTFSRAALAGSLLQYGKQGISIVHHGLKSAPAGRDIGSRCLRDVIWQGRNQSLHWEERTAKEAVEEVFDALANDLDPMFAEYKKRNLAFEVVRLLGWTSYDAFRGDMRSLG